jgi:endonuclease YncB( thermonuclease family)
MKYLLSIILAAVVAMPALAAKQKEGVVYDAKLTRLIDGDTVAFAATFLPAPLKPELLLRVYGVDTPEKGWRGKCDKEKAAGDAASAFTKNAIKNSTQHQIVLYGWDKFGGRVLGDILLDGESLRAMLIANGFAREYYGEAKQSWCN